MNPVQLKSWLESLLFVSERPLKVQEMLATIGRYQEALNAEDPGAGAVGDEAKDSALQSSETTEAATAEEQMQRHNAQESAKLGRSDIETLLREIAEGYRSREDGGILLNEVAGGWQFLTRPENGDFLRHHYQPKAAKLSKPSLETLAIVAYRQPVSRVEIDQLRGVDSGGVIKTLLEKDLLRIVGKKDEPGRSMLYGTTTAFLELFQLKNLQGLPTLRELRELEEAFQRKAEQEGLMAAKTSADEPAVGAESPELWPETFSVFEQEDADAIEALDSRLKELRRVEREIFGEPASEATDATETKAP